MAQQTPLSEAIHHDTETRPTFLLLRSKPEWKKRKIEIQTSEKSTMPAHHCCFWGKEKGLEGGREGRGGDIWGTSTRFLALKARVPPPPVMDASHSESSSSFLLTLPHGFKNCPSRKYSWTRKCSVLRLLFSCFFVQKPFLKPRIQAKGDIGLNSSRRDDAE